MKSPALFWIGLLVALGGIARGAEVTKPPAREPVASPAVTFQRFIGRGDGVMAQFAVTNPTERAVWFSGYAEMPLYEMEQWLGGRWVKKGIGFCGVGVERRLLLSPGSIVFEIPIVPEDRARAFRLGVELSTEMTKNGRYYWSDKVVPRDK